MAIVNGILWILLIISVLLLIAVILLQEGKGGGLAEAFGGVGAETFGVKAAGINKFTAIVGAVFLAICITLTLTLHTTPVDRPLIEPSKSLFPPGSSSPFAPPGAAPHAPPPTVTPPGDSGGGDKNK